MRLARRQEPTPGSRGGEGFFPHEGLFWLLLAVLLAIRVFAIYLESINWDEFALLARAAETARTGELQGGGRPGLATALLAPLAADCADAVAVIREARWWWTGITILLLAGFWHLIRIALPDSGRTRQAAVLALGLLVLVPVFLRWSLQVRTDQPAVMFGLWGGVALLASKHRIVWALAGGVLVGLGFLFSQKVIYVVALMGLLAVGRQWQDEDFDLRRDSSRTMLWVAGAGAAILLFQTWARSVWTAPALVPGGAFDVFGFYRSTVGYSVYLGMLPTLVPHAVLSLLLVGLIVTGRHRDLQRRRELTLGLGILVLGACVALFHAGAFPYFWLTLGLFPATAVAVAMGALKEALPARSVQVGTVGVWIVLIGGASLGATTMLVDSQRIQAESLAFIDRNFASHDRGFHPESALFCRSDPDPFDTYFTQTIVARFEGEAAEENTAGFLEEFRTRPVAFVVDSWRLLQFPQPVTELLGSAYVVYAHSVFVPGTWVPPDVTAPAEFEALVPGAYRWIPQGPSSDPVHARAGGLAVNGDLVAAGEEVQLGQGLHTLELDASGHGGLFVLALSEPPRRDTVEGFYQGYGLREFGGWMPPVWRVRQP